VDPPINPRIIAGCAAAWIGSVGTSNESYDPDRTRIAESLLDLRDLTGGDIRRNLDLAAQSAVLPVLGVMRTANISTSGEMLVLTKFPKARCALLSTTVARDATA
jgi:hypothetical protein